MKTSIRTRFFLWIAAQTLAVFLAIGLALYAFNLNERKEHPDMVEEEAEEFLAMAGLMALLLPLSIFTAWWVARRLMRPWQGLVTQAERIRDGQLDDRIATPNPQDEIGRLAAILNSAFDRYHQALDRLHRFSYDASHQLRNPLASIRLSGEVCLQQPRQPEEYASAIGKMLEDVTRLSRTVEQLLMLARAAGSELPAARDRVDLARLAEEVAEEARAVGESRQLRVQLQREAAALTVHGTAELLREALSNLVDNALRFSPDGGLVQIRLTRGQDGAARLEVSDEGPGVPPEHRDQLFRPFRRAAAHQGGQTGLGLALVADICRAHGGRAGVEARPGGGSIFWMEFPATGTP